MHFCNFQQNSLKSEPLRGCRKVYCDIIDHDIDGTSSYHLVLVPMTEADEEHHCFAAITYILQLVQQAS